MTAPEPTPAPVDQLTDRACGFTCEVAGVQASDKGYVKVTLKVSPTDRHNAFILADYTEMMLYADLHVINMLEEDTDIDDLLGQFIETER